MKRANLYRTIGIVTGLASPFVYDYGWDILGLVLGFVAMHSLIMSLVTDPASCDDCNHKE